MDRKKIQGEGFYLADIMVVKANTYSANLLRKLIVRLNTRKELILVALQQAILNNSQLINHIFSCS